MPDVNVVILTSQPVPAILRHPFRVPICPA